MASCDKMGLMKTHWFTGGTTALLLLAVSACSTQAWYEGLHLKAQADCDRLPPGAAQDCRDRLVHPPFDTYEKERSGTK
jgi:hypothetical protein